MKNLLNLCMCASLLYIGANLAYATDNTTTTATAISQQAPANKILDSRKTPYGTLSLQQAKPDDQTNLFFNDKLIHISQNGDSSDYGYKLAIVKDYKLNKDHVFLISNDPGGNSLPIKYALVQPKSKDDIKVSKLFVLLHTTKDIHLKRDKLIIKVKNYLPYASKNDYAIYEYTTDKGLELIKDHKPDSYYKDLYAKKNAKYILRVAKKDGCLDDKGQISTAHSCQWGVKYCFMFKSLAKPTKADAAYTTLASSFEKADCMQGTEYYK